MGGGPTTDRETVEVTPARHRLSGMYLHLDPIGGVSGDMFAAAIFDTFPELVAEFESVLAATDLARLATVELIPHRDHALTGSRFVVTAGTDAHRHRSFAEIRSHLCGSGLDRAVCDRAIEIFELLAEAEGSVHGVAPETVTFHEVGAWDSVVDIVAAAWLIETLKPSGWSCSGLPLGSGHVQSAHGLLPVPAPARINTGPSVVSAASRCGGFSAAR